MLRLGSSRMIPSLARQGPLRSSAVRAPIAQMLRFYSGAPSKVQELTNLNEFASFVGSKEKLSVIDFYATWCGPCKALEPIFAMLAERVPEVQFGRVDVDNAQDVAQEYAISAMPTCLFFKDGEKVDSIIGANPPKLVELIKQYSGVDISGR